jgi:hypothetical protein
VDRASARRAGEPQLLGLERLTGRAPSMLEGSAVTAALMELSFQLTNVFCGLEGYAA